MNLALSSKKVRIVGDDSTAEKLAGKDIICCGDTEGIIAEENEKVFRSTDGRYYFTICDGWGSEDDTLYGLGIQIFHDSGHPTTPESALAECTVKPEYHT